MAQVYICSVCGKKIDPASDWVLVSKNQDGVETRAHATCEEKRQQEIVQRRQR